MSQEPGANPADSPASAPQVQRWPSEIPLLCVVAVVSFWIWLALALSILGIVYVALIGAFLFLSHVAFVTYIRGSAIRLSDRQFPELHARVVELSRRAGLRQPPDSYVLQAGGSLNAFATKLFRSRMIVLYSDLLDACEGDDAARDMIIGHEIGHLKSRHLDFHWLLVPGYLVPFLGAAYSRACELTCDRWGRALCGDDAGASRGLVVLAAGGRLASRVDVAGFVDQKRDLDTGWLTLGKWLAPYPPLSRRIELLRPDLPAQPFLSTRGPVRAIAILLVAGLVPMAGMGFAFWKLMSTYRNLAALGSPGGSAFAADGESDGSELSTAEIQAARLQVSIDFDRLETLLREELAAGGSVPEEIEDLAALWERRRAGPFLTDPFSGSEYGYLSEGGTDVLIYSAGPDGEQATADDIDYSVSFGDPSGG
ncbi:MAG: M48 family metalloprotease [Thermoanaerobaculia bacterium]